MYKTGKSKDFYPNAIENNTLKKPESYFASPVFFYL